MKQKKLNQRKKRELKAWPKKQNLKYNSLKKIINLKLKN